MKKSGFVKMLSAAICCSLLITGCSFVHTDSKAGNETVIKETVNSEAVQKLPEAGEPSEGSENKKAGEVAAENLNVQASEPAPESVPEQKQESAPEAETAEQLSEMNSEITPRIVTITLDPGHGGGYSGAVYNGRSEKNMTLTVARYVEAYLLDNYSNIEVTFTRNEDAALSGDIVKDLEMRAEAAKQAGAEALVSLHFNASEAHNADGATVYVTNRKGLHSEASALAECILKELEKLGLKNRGALTRNSNDMVDEEGKPLDYYAINRHAANRELVGIIVEHCFMDNEADEPYYGTEEALKRLAEADARGIAEYFELVHK